MTHVLGSEARRVLERMQHRGWYTASHFLGRLSRYRFRRLTDGPLWKFWDAQHVRRQLF